MSEYIVSARKYRPATFDTVVGQDALVKTLKNAIASNKLAHAYLFCGPRGVGKTTCARIFAKTINCEHRTADGEACNECESCQSFNEQRSFNIHELDAASNNSVDNIRELIDQVKIPPQIGNYKVFIIDEVHMLSQAAFNAFLKTLEEPPKHAIFIMATTEKQKILPTILSRCQTYDFQRISNIDITAQLARIAAREGIKAEPQALQVIATKADGGMRDALSIFDQIASFSAGNITYQATINNLNILDYELFFRLTEDAILGNAPAALIKLDETIRRGFDPQHFIGGWASHIRDLMVSKDPATLKLIEAGPEIAQKYQAQAAKCPPQFLLYGLQIANECDFNYRNSRNKRLSVELAIIKICHLLHPLGQAQPPKQSAPTPTSPQTPQQPVQQTRPQVQPQQPVQQTRPVQAPQQQAQPLHPVQQATVPRNPAGILSIRNLSQPNQQQPATQASTTQPTIEEDNDVDPSDLNVWWKKFAQEISDERLLAGIINECLPEPASADNLNYVVSLSSEEQMNLINSHKERILNYLKRNLHNSKISLSLQIKKTKKQNVFMTPRERFNELYKYHQTRIDSLMEKFPHLELV